jgi:hypothetical protein
MPLAWFLLGLLGLVAPASTLAMEVACANPDVTAAGWAQADAEQICPLVQDALDWLRTMGPPALGKTGRTSLRRTRRAVGERLKGSITMTHIWPSSIVGFRFGDKLPPRRIHGPVIPSK